MKIATKDFRVREGREVNLRKWPTNVEPVYKSKEHYQKLLGEHVAQLSTLQELLYASNRYAVLLIFQAMDAAGKDGAIKHVMSGVNPQGCQVFSFKHPSPTELQHDFLWRTTRDLPERGRIGIFNRSYYEEVLIVRVHPEILRSKGIPDAPHTDNAVWHDRYRSIVDLERHLTVMEPASSSSSSTSRRRSSESVSFNASMCPKRTGNLALRILRRENSGSITCRRMRNASVRQAPGTRPGMSFPLMT
jgi:polyphosphate kinase 2 (PPK2 family)